MCGSLDYHTDKIEYLENQSRRSNIRIDGILEEEAETWDNTETKVKPRIYSKRSAYLSFEISRPHGKNIIGGVIYRPPNQRVGDFVSKHNDLLAKISRENKICFIMGDFNLNLINFQHHQNTGEFLDGLH